VSLTAAIYADPSPTPTAPPVVLDCAWVPDGRPGASAGCYVVQVTWKAMTWTCVRPMLPGYGNRDGDRLCVFVASLMLDSRLLRHFPREAFLAVVDAAIERELEAGAADYAAELGDDQGGD
jgi:hypothetical protein